jgi:hypothetical protein
MLLKNCTFNGQLDLDSAESLAFAYMLFHLSHCLLQHPFLLRRRLEEYEGNYPASFLFRSITDCQTHAHKLTKNLQEAQLAGCQLKSSFYGFATMVAGTINALHQYSDDEFVRRESIENMLFDQAFLEEHSKYWENAGKMVCIYDVLQPSVRREADACL